MKFLPFLSGKSFFSVFFPFPGKKKSMEELFAKKVSAVRENGISLRNSLQSAGRVT